VNGLHTPACALLGIDVPIVGAGMGGLAGAELAAAISNAGALGVIGAGGDPTALVLARLRDARIRSDRPIGVNFVLEVVPAERVLGVLDAGVDVLVTGWGDPAPWVEPCHARGTLLVHRVENAAQAAEAAAAGVDAVVAQGSDAGGHTGSVPTMALVPCVVDAVDGLPVLAAGGIADGRGLVAALALGADGVVLGTRFVAAAEAYAHPDYRRLVIEATETDSIRTDLFELGWPDRPHRVLRNSTVANWELETEPRRRPRDRSPEIVAHRRRGAEVESVPRFWVDSPTADVLDGAEAMALYAGPSAGLVRSVEPAGTIVAAILEEAGEALAGLRAGRSRTAP
jgi:NAD(P)H-dependent flavin oxidoreductase YrpB (nitropropane dioxygenase family)